MYVLCLRENGVELGDGPKLRAKPKQDDASIWFNKAMINGQIMLTN